MARVLPGRRGPVDERDQPVEVQHLPVRESERRGDRTAQSHYDSLPAQSQHTVTAQSQHRRRQVTAQAQHTPVLAQIPCMLGTPEPFHLTLECGIPRAGVGADLPA